MNDAMVGASHYEMFARDGVTHLYRTANADSRDTSSWAKVVGGDAATVSVELQRLSGSPNAWLPSAWPGRDGK